MSKYIDLMGQRFGKLVVIEKIGVQKNLKYGGMWWLCRCDCGNEKRILGSSLRGNKTKSCGCISKEGKDNKNFADLTGKKFNRLLVVERIRNPNMNSPLRHLWRCVCDCGNETFLVGNLITSGATKSCGCLSIEKSTKRIRELKNNKGVKSVENSMLSQYKFNAKNRNLAFDISDDFFKIIIHMPCFYCGNIDIRNNHYTKEEFLLNGIDRINSSIGYTSSNVVPCCAKCNHGKNNMPQKEFLSWVSSIYNYSIKNNYEKEGILFRQLFPFVEVSYD